MEARKFHRIYWIIKLSFFIGILSSCNDKNEMKDILKDTSSNAFYICIRVKNEYRVQEVVIPNNKLYYIFNSEKRGEFDIESYMNVIYPILAKDDVLEVSEGTFNKLQSYFLQANWASKEINIDDYFIDGVQVAPIEDEKTIIKQLYDMGYLTYKDDETGMLVLKEM